MEKPGRVEVKKVLHFRGVGGGAAVLCNRFRMRSGCLNKLALFMAGKRCCCKRENKLRVGTCTIIETDQASTAVGSCDWHGCFIEQFHLPEKC